MQKPAIFLMGPTAAGKTAVAIQLAQLLPVDIISVDSALVYRGMDIGTGKPNATELALAPHQLIDICDPSTPYSVAQFVLDAQNAMHNSWQQQRIPLLVGGTMLYFRALQFGLAPLPAADPNLRVQLNAQAATIGWPAMHAQLAQLDPISAQRIKPNDTQRIQRALEINLLTGTTLGEFFAQQKPVDLNYKLHAFAIMPHDRTQLQQTIAQRFDQMLANGFVAEVERLLARGDLHADLPAIRSVGYAQIWAYLTQQIDYTTMRAQALAATRQLAKRQYTWLRNWPAPIVIQNSATALLDSITKSVLDSGKHLA